MNKIITDSALCTACGLCENICPKDCVVRKQQISSFAMLKGDECINCGLCEKVCPIHSLPELNYPHEAYAAWSTDAKLRERSASGGIAATLYRNAVSKGYYFVGAQLDQNYECHLKIGKSNDEIEDFQNSKYTYSFADDVYKKVAETIKSGKKTLFIGLPCQVAAMKKYTEVLHISTENLLLVDIICHGTPNPKYLKDHIAAISQKLGKQIVQCYFRDAKFDASNYAYTLYTHNSDEPIYVKYVEQDDLYQIGYHCALIYRDSCYSCRFAQGNRAGDLTIGDFHVWDVDSCEIDIRNVSSVLVNTNRGKELLQTLADEKQLEMIERPLEEPFNGEKQLRYPSVAGPERERMLKFYAETGNYEIAAQKAFKKIVLKRKLHIDQAKAGIKKCIKMFIPRKMWLAVKQKYKK